MKHIFAGILFVILTACRAFAANEGVASMPVPTLPLSGPELVYCLQGGANTQCTAGEIATTYTNDPYNYGASGMTGTTTGTITGGTSSLAVASAAGWLPGMGIAVANAGTGGNTECITSVLTIVSTTFTLAATCPSTANTQTVNHDDTAAFSAAITASLSSGWPVHCRVDNYNITSVLTFISVPIEFYGDGTNACILVNQAATNYVLRLTYNTSSLTPSSLTAGGANIHDFQIQGTKTQSTGGAIRVGTGGAGGTYTYACDVHDIVISGMWLGLETELGVAGCSFHDVQIFGNTAWGIFTNTDSPGGYNTFRNMTIIGSNASGAAVNIVKGSGVTFQNVTINGSYFEFTGGSNSAITNATLDNVIVLAGSASCALDFHSGATGVNVKGGYFGGATTQICNSGNVVGSSGGFGGLSVIGTLFGDSSNVMVGTQNFVPFVKYNTLYSAAGTAAPTCNAAAAGMEILVTDATSPTYNGAYTSGGTAWAKLICEGPSGVYAWATH